jgi:hypothetical protein
MGANGLIGAIGTPLDYFGEYSWNILKKTFKIFRKYFVLFS